MIEFPPLPSGQNPLWDGEAFQVDGQSSRVVVYSSNYSGWDDDLTDLHETEAGQGGHPMDLASRKSALDALRRHGVPERGRLLEIGCSTGFMLSDIKRAYPHAEIVGADIGVKALERLSQTLHGVPLIQMDLLQCPLPANTFDAIIALNVLEHIGDDQTALQNMANLLKPGGKLILEVPQGPQLYDYYDAHLRHFRRYSRASLVARVESVGLQTLESGFVGFLSYIPFFLMKKLSRFRYGIKGERCSTSVEKMVRNNIKATSTSKALDLAFLLDAAIGKCLPLPFGIRCTAVATRP